MQRADEGRNCPACGAILERGGAANPAGGERSGLCLRCAESAHSNDESSAELERSERAATELKILPSIRDGEAPVAVKLIRELKMPTVDRLVTGPDVEGLPAAMASVEEAVDRGDLETADERLDQALGTMLEGPGHERRGTAFGFLPMVLIVWCGILLVLLVLSLLL